MSLYITDHTSVEDIVEAKNSGSYYFFNQVLLLLINELKFVCFEGVVYGAKLYPAGATTNSDLGVTSIEKIKHVLQVFRSRIGSYLLLLGTILVSYF